MKKPEEINYEPMGSALLVYPPKSDSNIILLGGSNMGLGCIVAKLGAGCTRVKVGDKVMFDSEIFPLNIDGVEYWQIAGEHLIFGKVLNNGKVKQGDKSVFEPKDPTSHYNS